MQRRQPPHKKLSLPFPDATPNARGHLNAMPRKRSHIERIDVIADEHNRRNDNLAPAQIEQPNVYDARCAPLGRNRLAASLIAIVGVGVAHGR
jgi:hypothetical protein